MSTLWPQFMKGLNPVLLVIGLPLLLIALNVSLFSFETTPPNTKDCITHALLPNSKMASHCEYPSEITASQAIVLLRDKWIVFMGESTLRQVYLQFLGIIKSESYDRIVDQKGERVIEERLAGSRYTFNYLEYYDNITDTLTNHGAPTLSDGRKPDLLILNDGLHDLLYNRENTQTAWDKLAHLLTDTDNTNSKIDIPILWVTPPQIHDEHLTKGRKDSEWFRNQTVYNELFKPQKELFEGTKSNSALKLLYFYNTFHNLSYEKWEFDGLHNMQRSRYEAEGLVRAFYYLDQDSKAWKTDVVTAGQMMVFIAYLVITVIVIIGELFRFVFYKEISEFNKNKKAKSSSLSLMDVKKAVKSEKQSLMNSASEGGGGDKDINVVIAGNGAAPALHTQISPDDNDKNNQNRKVINTDLAKKMNETTKGSDNDKEKTGKSGNKTEKANDSEEDKYEIRTESAMIKRYLGVYIENRAILISAFQFAICIVLVYLIDGPEHMFVSPSLKHYNRDFFIFLHLMFLLLSSLTFVANKGRDGDMILSRDQTEEWKGIMQIVFVMYHYFDAKEVYNLIRVFIGAYVWMTGFGNTRFFVLKGCFSANRLIGMLFRLNWLVFWVCLIMNQPLMLYYICPLHTFYFLCVYLTWGIGYQYNETWKGKCVKLLVSGALLCVMFEFNANIIFNNFWFPLKWLFGLHGTLYEWHFRTTLDHYATWLGMVFGVFYDQIYAFLTKKCRFLYKILISAICGISVILWYMFVYRHDKYTYNAMHPYFEAIPIFSYIILRNIFGAIRPYYSSFLAEMGKITLETYIFQYHLYMINDAKSILTVIQGYPLCNFMIVSLFYVLVSRCAFDSTNALRNYFYHPRDKQSTNWDVIKRTLIYFMYLFILYLFSLLCVTFLT